MSKESNAKYIYCELTKAGATPEGACGMLANIDPESGFNPSNLEDTYNSKFGMTDAEYVAMVNSGHYSNFIHDSAGFGLCQWTFWSRKELLMNWMKDRHASIDDFKEQVAFMIWELQNCYPKVWATLKKATSVRKAAETVLTDYENPLDQGKSVKDYRTFLAEAWYKKLVSDQIPPVEQTEPTVEPVQGYFPPRTIDRNMVGSDVLMMQAILNCRGYGCRCDGIFGLETERKVKQFQTDEKLDSVDGICGKKTWTKLFKVKWG